MIDWVETFRPATLCLFNGCDPYATIYNVPWVLFPLIPFALLPNGLGEILLMGATLTALVLVSLRLSRHWIGVFAFIFNPITWNALMFGNVEWLCLLGLVCHPVVGLLLLAIKPQMTLCVIAFMLLERKRYAVLLGSAVALACVTTPLISRLALYQTYQDSVVNTSLGLVGIAIGTVLIGMAFKTRRREFALAATPFLFAVVTPQTWLVVPLATIGLYPITIVLLLSAWAYVGWVRL